MLTVDKKGFYRTRSGGVAQIDDPNCELAGIGIVLAVGTILGRTPEDIRESASWIPSTGKESGAPGPGPNDLIEFLGVLYDASLLRLGEEK